MSRPDALWGYSVADIDRLALYAVKSHLRWWKAGDRGDQKDAAWEGITDMLLTTAERPSDSDLIWAGIDAISKYVRAEKRHHGVPRDHGMTGERFDVYWTWFARVTPSPEERITDRIAVLQILATLTKRQMEALNALAAYGDYAVAAAALGITRTTFHTRMSAARDRFRQLWHEGETPPKKSTWRKDVRKKQI